MIQEGDTISLKSKVRSDVPEGHLEESGYCFSDALRLAGYDTDLPPWVHVDDVPIVCQELGLEYLTGQGRKITLSKGSHIIVGYVVQRSKDKNQKRIGHWEFTDKPEELFQRINQKDVFALIRVPS